MADNFDGQLTEDAIRAIYFESEGDSAAAQEPILQVMSCKKVNSTNATNVDRYRLILSDGVYFAQAMVATALNHLVQGESPQVDKNTIVRLSTYSVNNVQNRRIVICLGIEPITHWHERIGNPTSVDTAAPPAPAAAAAANDNKPVTAGRGGSNASSTNAAKRSNAPAKALSAGGRPGAPIYPIEGLSPYQNKWTIKARVTQKSDIRHWSNQRGDGKLFSVNLLDESGEIRATGFNEAVDNLYNVLEENKVYYISKARVNIAKKQFSNLSNEYEITFEKDTDVQLCEDQEAVPQMKFDFVEIGDLINKEKDATVDILGIVRDSGAINEITTKTQKQLKKRDLTVVDRSGYNVRVTLWGKAAENWQDTDNGLFAFKGAKVGDFGGRTLSMSGASTIQADPDIEEAHMLRGWYDTEGHTMAFQSFNGAMTGGGSTSFKKDEFKTLQEVIDLQLGMGDKPDYFATRATIAFVKPDNLSYPACPTEKCNKKMVLTDDNDWRCERCDKTFPAPDYRYILSMTVSDFTGQIWLNGFNEQGEQLLGKTANEMNTLKEEDSGAFEAVTHAAIGKTYNFSIRAKADTFRDETRVRYHIQKAAPVDYAEAAKQMLDTLSQMSI
ncbi:Replication factor A protein 1 [Microbotryomycetes sp. JL201]|nr:Replication factor A protein 1 [Microbotryomycetes sp. JL201]